MSTYIIAHRLFRLVIFLYKNGTSSRDEISKALAPYGIHYNRQLLGRDIERLKDEFNIFIDSKQGASEYTLLAEWTKVNEFIKYLDLISTADLLQSAIKGSPENLELIHFHRPSVHIGLDNFKPLLEAIKSRKKVSFTHENYYANTHKPYQEVEPLLLKEYLNRWYLIAFTPQHQALRTFGMDRIKDLQISESLFKPRSIDAKKGFNEIVGLNYSSEKALLVKVAYTEQQWKYQKAIPLHSSQKKLEDHYSSTHPILVAYYLKLNFELTQQILSLGSQIIIVEPKELKTKIIKELKASLKNY